MYPRQLEIVKVGARRKEKKKRKRSIIYPHRQAILSNLCFTISQRIGNPIDRKTYNIKSYPLSRFPNMKIVKF